MSEQMSVYAGGNYSETHSNNDNLACSTPAQAIENLIIIPSPTNKSVNNLNQQTKNPASQLLIRYVVAPGYWVTKKVVEYIVVQVVVEGVVKPTYKKVVKYVKEWVPPVYGYRPRPSSPTPSPADNSNSLHPGNHPLKQFPVAGLEVLIKGDIK